MQPPQGEDTMTSYNLLNTKNTEKLIPDNVVIIDVRTDMEHAEKRLACDHLHIPLCELKAGDFMAQHGLETDSEIYIICRSGKRAENAAEMFIARGCRNVHAVEGGLIACEEHGYPVIGHVCRQEKNVASPVSLERQVRIAAGACVAIGAVLALFLNPLFSIIPIFLGCGLVFAGITDRCGMALILIKATWNKISPVSDKGEKYE